jgi:hypothetical protein
MYWRKKYYRTLWKSTLPLTRRFDLSNGLFSGREAYIFAAGPSLKNIDVESLRLQLDKSLVICIKQSIDIVDFDCDALIMNFCNFSGYEWDRIQCPTFWTTFDRKHNEMIQAKGANCNATFDVVENGPNTAAGFSLSTAGGNRWENFDKITDGKARWGPGLMYELAIPLALLAGVSHINLVSWDIGTISQENDTAFHNEHFYEQNKVEMSTKITNLEITTVANSTLALRNWLAAKGVGLSVISDRSLVHESIPRKPEWIIQ